MTRVFKPIYLDETSGELARMPDGGLLSIGGTTSTTFTVGGRALLFDDGTSTGVSTGSGFTLQVAYGNSLVPAQINLTTGKDIILNATNSNKFIFSANTGNVSIGGDLNLGGLLNGIAIADIVGHFNASATPKKHTAEQISFDDTGLSNISGSDVQAAIESIDSQLTSIGVGNVTGFEFVQNTPSAVWYIPHGGGSSKVHATVWASTTRDFGSGPVPIQEVVIPDQIAIVDNNVVYIIFASPQTGRAVLMLF